MIRIALIATFIAVASSTLAHAECVQLNVATVARYADAVFSGRITDADGSTITFEVDRVWKGPVTKRFTVYRVNSVEAFQPAVGSEYLVFARRASDNDAFDAMVMC